MGVRRKWGTFLNVAALWDYGILGCATGPLTPKDQKIGFNSKGGPKASVQDVDKSRAARFRPAKALAKLRVAVKEFKFSCYKMGV